MSEKGRQIAKRFYEGLYKIPGVNRIVGKIEIAYNQFWIDRHQKEAAKVKRMIDSLSLQLDSLARSEAEIEKLLADDSLPVGKETLSIKLSEIQRKKNELENKRDGLQTKLKARENKVETYASKRDKVAHRLIEYYGEKLRPMEEELRRLEEYKKEAERLIEDAQKRHQQMRQGIEENKKKRDELIRVLVESELALASEDKRRDPDVRRKIEEKVNKTEAVQFLNNVIKYAENKIKEEETRLNDYKEKIERRIREVNDRANPYRDRMNEFARVTHVRPIDVDVPPKSRVSPYERRYESRSQQYEFFSLIQNVFAYLVKSKEFSEIASNDRTSEEISKEYATDFLERMKDLSFKKGDKVEVKAVRDLLKEKIAVYLVAKFYFNEGDSRVLRDRRKKIEKAIDKCLDGLLQKESQ
jgi:hypothetical protein